MPAVWSDLLNAIVGISIGVTAKGWGPGVVGMHL